jgi:hypothetical protein
MYALEAVMEISDGTCPAFAWVATPMSAFLRFAGPEELGGFGDLDAKMKTAAEREGRSLLEIAASMGGPVGDDIVRVPGLPDMYHYEYHPQEVRSPFSCLRDAD